jgi:hypothetical protein
MIKFRSSASAPGGLGLSGIAIAAVVSCALLAPTASAVPMGTLQLATDGQQVTVGLYLIDWHPLGPPSGSFVVGNGTTLTCTGAGCSPVGGQSGTILDLDAGPPPNPAFPVMNFMTFASQPGLRFDLNSIGPGAPNTDCSTVDSAGETCSPFAGSPFVLLWVGPTSTAVILSAQGTATDSTGTSNWAGSFSTNISDRNPFQIQQFFGCTPGQGPASCTNQAGTLNSTYAGDFTATIIPEPTTWLTLGGSLIALGLVRRRRR